MNWPIIQKNPAQFPVTGTYKQWKPLLAREATNKCVYCAIHENQMGGIRNFHVEHYRPKSKFKKLENDFQNLFYSCPVCNTFKSNDWPNEPTGEHSIVSYPDPSATNYNHLFDVDTRQGVIQGKNVAAKYVQEKLFLNRPQLITERKIASVLTRSKQAIDKTKELLEQLTDNSDYKQISQEFMGIWSEWDTLKEKLREVPRYGVRDTQRS